MAGNFALIDQALVIFVHELDWIFNRDDVLLLRHIDRMN